MRTSLTTTPYAYDVRYLRRALARMSSDVTPRTVSGKGSRDWTEEKKDCFDLPQKRKKQGRKNSPIEGQISEG